MTNPITELLAYDLNSVDPRKAKDLLFKYLKYILYENKKIKVFNGIPREYTKKYMVDFYKMIRENLNETGELVIPLKLEQTDNYTCYFVFVDGRGHAFGSFKKAYIYACKEYLDCVILYEDDIIKDIADNAMVFFGQVLVKNGKMIHKDLIEVVNHSYYGFVNDELLSQ